MQEIKQRWLSARKIYGLDSEITTASGVKVRGRFVLTNSGDCTPSHDPTQMFCKSVGFPTDKNGQSVNDRDYERDLDAQQITRQIAAQYDSRALQSPVIVTKDGIVLSGNGRTMAGMLAARDNTDSAYIEYLSRYSLQYGFSSESVKSFSHPRVLFETADDYPYTADTFAMFNAQEIKSQSKTEQSVKLGKLVDDETFHRIIRNINQFDTIGDFYNNVRAATESIQDLRDVGVISQMQYPEMFDGDTISSQAREILENVLIGKAFSSNPDAVRQITAFKGIRKNVITALAEISTNLALGEYSLESEMAQAVGLCYNARSNGGMHQGDIVSGFARQMTMFGETETIADFTNSTVMLLSDMLNHNQVTRLRKVFALYNSEAHDAASGQCDMFSGGVKSRQEILDDVCNAFNYSSQKELNERLDAANQQKKRNAYTERKNDVRESSVNCNSVAVTPAKFEEYTIVGLKTPNGIIPVKLELIDGEEAGIRLKGWLRYRVPLSSLTHSDAESPSLPEWIKVNQVLSDGEFIRSINRGNVTLSNGITFRILDLLLYYSPALADAA